jgi:cytoskeleton protein RodZ
MDKKSLGQTLRQAREQRGQSLDALAVATRIPSPVLEALEQDAFGELPADVYLRGFVRSYCRATGLPEAEPLVMLEETLVTRRQSAAPDPGSKPGEVGRPIMPVVQLGSAGRRRIRILGAIAAVLILGALFWFLR